MVARASLAGSVTVRPRSVVVTTEAKHADSLKNSAALGLGLGIGFGAANGALQGAAAAAELLLLSRPGASLSIGCTKDVKFSTRLVEMVPSKSFLPRHFERPMNIKPRKRKFALYTRSNTPHVPLIGCIGNS